MHIRNQTRFAALRTLFNKTTHVGASWQLLTACISFSNCSFTFDTTVASYVNARCLHADRVTSLENANVEEKHTRRSAIENENETKRSPIRRRSYRLLAHTLTPTMRRRQRWKMCSRRHEHCKLVSNRTLYSISIRLRSIVVVNFDIFSDSITNLSYTSIFEAKSDPLNFITPV